MEIKRVALIGLGAVGCTYGELLNDLIGEDFWCIADGERASRLKREGYIINSRQCNFNCKPPSQQGDIADLVIFTVKFNQLGQAIEDARNFIGPDTLIMSILNGISSEEQIGAAYGIERVVYGKAFRIDAVRSGKNITFSSRGYIQMGIPKKYNAQDKVKAVAELFDKAGIEYEVPDDIIYAIWWKYMVNNGLNQVSAVLRAPYVMFQRVQEVYDLMKDAMLETVAVANSLGIALKPSDVEDFNERILRHMSVDGMTSMLQDVLANRQTEVEMFAGELSRIARGHGIKVPVNEMLLRQIRALDRAVLLGLRG